MTLPPLNRRHFMISSATGTLAAATGLQSTILAEPLALPEPAVTANPLPIVDTHQHLWDLDKFTLPWCKDIPSLNRSYVTSHYLQATQGLNVVKTVYMEVDVTPSQQSQEADYVLDLCRTKGNPMVGAVISGRPATAAFRDFILKFKGNEFIKGVRQVLHGDGDPQGFVLDRSSSRVYNCWGNWACASTSACDPMNSAMPTNWLPNARRPDLWLTTAGTSM